VVTAITPRLLDTSQMSASSRVLVGAIAVSTAALALGLAGWRSPQPASTFDHVHGWIAVVGDPLVAIDPKAPHRRVILSTRGGAPLAWSRDGSELLVEREHGLFVLDGDGRETRVAPRGSGGSFTPDGRDVVYGGALGGIHEVSVTGGRSRDIATAGRSSFLLQSFGGGQLSPDGATVAAARLRHGRPQLGIWLLNVNGTPHARMLVSPAQVAPLLGGTVAAQTYPLAWSTDGSRFAFSVWSRSARQCVVFTVRADGTGLQRASPLNLCVYSATWGPSGKLMAVAGRALPQPAYKAAWGPSGTWIEVPRGTRSQSGVSVVSLTFDGMLLRGLGRSPNPDLDVPSIAWNPL
jgi:Tol biopolymer transport system component